MRLAHKDPYGRWVHIDLLGRDGRLVSIICAYQVVQEKGSHGDRTTYSQQVRLMRLSGIQDPDPRKQFIRDLRTLVSSLRKTGNDIILISYLSIAIKLLTRSLVWLPYPDLVAIGPCTTINGFIMI